MEKPFSKNNYGFFEINKKPSESYLAEYYENKYFNSSKSYNYTLLDIEVKAKEINSLLLLHALHTLGHDNPKRETFVEVGFGEGFLLKSASECGYTIQGFDFSSEQILDINSSIKNCTSTSNSPFDTFLSLELDTNILCLRNVLEHVRDPIELVKCIFKKLQPGSILAIEVPNDFSELQGYLADSNFISNQYWICPPDHLSYFSEVSLCQLLADNGFTHQLTLGSFPIEIFLLGEESNYNKHPDRGKSAHHARCLFDIFMFDTYGIEALFNLYTNRPICNISRTITCIFFSKP